MKDDIPEPESAQASPPDGRRSGALCLHLPFRAADADDRGAGAQGTTALGAARRARRFGSPRAAGSGVGLLSSRSGEGGAWRLVKPETYPADSVPVMDLVRELASLKRAGGDPTGARPDAYGLDAPRGEGDLHWSEGADAAEEEGDARRRVRHRDPGGRHRRGARRGHRERDLREGVGAAGGQEERQRFQEPRSLQRLGLGRGRRRHRARPRAPRSGARRAGRGGCSSPSTIWRTRAL